jgi:signal transduction histidine kinase
MLRAVSDLVLRRYPVAVLVVLLAAGTALPFDSPFGLLVAVPIYGLAAYRSWRAAAAATAALVVASFAHRLLYESTDLGSMLAAAASSAAFGAAASGMGVAVAERRRSREQESALRAERALVEERLRIARELHDAVGHDVSLMIVQAQALGATAGDDAVREATDAIADLGRRTMREMQRTLHLLREEAAEYQPQSGLAALDELLDGAKRAGVPVTVTMEGTPRELEPALDASAFRIVQEAVTNVVRHAGGAPANVTLRYGAGELELVIADEGRGTRDPGATSGGHGLIGMRERVALFGGTLHAGPRDGDGFEVRALLPYAGGRDDFSAR